VGGMKDSNSRVGIAANQDITRLWRLYLREHHLSVLCLFKSDLSGS